MAESDARNRWVSYEPDTIELVGVLQRRVYAGAPNYKSVSRGDARDVGYYLTLPEPLCVSQNVSETNVPAARVRRIRPVLDRADPLGCVPMLANTLGYVGAFAGCSRALSRRPGADGAATLLHYPGSMTGLPPPVAT